MSGVAKLHVGIVLLTLFVGCQKNQPKPIANQPPAPAAPLDYVFYTTEQEVPERFIFAIHGAEVFVQAPEKQEDGTTKLRHYQRTDLPEEFRRLIDKSANRSQTAFSMLNGGQIVSNGPEVMYLHTVSHDRNQAESWDSFIADDDVQSLLDSVKDTAVADQYEVDQPPAWVKDEPRVFNDFFGPGQPP